MVWTALRCEMQPGRCAPVAAVREPAVPSRMERLHTAPADLSKLFPIIMPPDWVSPHWGGPIDQIGRGALHMTWAVQGDDRRRSYVSDEQAAGWDAEGIDWRAAAYENARRLSLLGGFGTKEDEAGSAVIKVMLNDDGLGPSRLFVPHLFAHELGDDYRVAIPEMTCAVAFRSSLTSDQEADVAGIIAGCYGHGTTPVSDERFSAADFWIG